MPVVFSIKFLPNTNSIHFPYGLFTFMQKSQSDDGAAVAAAASAVEMNFVNGMATVWKKREV